MPGQPPRGSLPHSCTTYTALLDKGRQRFVCVKFGGDESVRCSLLEVPGPRTDKVACLGVAPTYVVRHEANALNEQTIAVQSAMLVKRSA